MIVLLYLKVSHLRQTFLYLGLKVFRAFAKLSRQREKHLVKQDICKQTDHRIFNASPRTMPRLCREKYRLITEENLTLVSLENIRVNRIMLSKENMYQCDIPCSKVLKQALSRSRSYQFYRDLGENC